MNYQLVFKLVRPGCTGKTFRNVLASKDLSNLARRKVAIASQAVTKLLTTRLEDWNWAAKRFIAFYNFHAHHMYML